jgi:hypothetical protein
MIPIRLVITFVLLIASAACGRADDAEPPVATPTVTLNQSNIVIGGPVDITYRFDVARAAPPSPDEYLVFVHFLDADGELMWTDDHPPPTPVRQWSVGSPVEYTRTIFIPKFPYVGEAGVEIGIFSPQTGERLPLAAQTDGQRSYRVATFNLRLQTDNLFVVFRDGWHDTEVPDDGSGLEWQWSRGMATLSFRNPRRDVVVFLQVDQPVPVFPEPQRVEIRLGQGVIDSFPVPPGDRVLRRIALTADKLGSGEMVDLALAVDKTFVPAALPALKSTDPRELGIRVFRAFVQPS